MVLLLNTIRLALTKQEQISEKNPEFIRDVIAYINQNVVHAPSLDDLAEKFYVSKYYLSHRFKEYTQTTIHRTDRHLARQLCKIMLHYFLQ